MIPVPDAEAAYNRITHFVAQPGDVELLIAAAAQGGMPAPIVSLGNAVKLCEDTSAAYRADSSEANAAAWQAADAALREYIANHVDFVL